MTAIERAPTPVLKPGTRVLVAARNLYLGAGGMERTAVNLANHLLQEGMEVGALYRETEQAEPLYPLVEGVRHFSGSFEPSWLFETATIFQPEVIVFFYATWQESREATALADTGIPLVLHEGTNPERAINNNWAAARSIPVEQAAEERLALMSMCSRIRFTLPDYRNSLPETWRSASVAFPNAFEAADPADIALRDKEQRKFFINIGGLKRVKNVLAAVEAFGQISHLIPEWDFHIFSARPVNSDTLERIEAYCTKHHLKDRIRVFPPTRAVGREYGRSQVHVIASKEEGLPNCVAEASRHGLPSIGFACCPGTNSLIVHERNGLLARCGEGEIGDLAAQMLRLATDDEERLTFGRAAFEESRMFDPTEIFRQWRALIAEAAADRQDRATLLKRHRPADARRIRSIQRGTLLSRSLPPSYPPASTLSVIVAFADDPAETSAGLASLREAGADEVILVDGGRSDYCSEVAARYAAAHGWRLIKLKGHESLAACRNAGLAAATCDAVHFWTPGTGYRPGGLADAFENMRRYAVDIGLADPSSGSELVLTTWGLQPNLIDSAARSQIIYDRRFLADLQLEFHLNAFHEIDFLLRAFPAAERIATFHAVVAKNCTAETALSDPFPLREAIDIVRSTRLVYAEQGRAGLEPLRQAYVIGKLIAPALLAALTHVRSQGSSGAETALDHDLMEELRLLLADMPDGLRAARCEDPGLHLALFALRKGYIIWLHDLLSRRLPRRFAVWMLIDHHRDVPVIREKVAALVGK